MTINSRVDAVRGATDSVLKKLEFQPPATRGRILAELRRSLGKSSTESPEVWGFIFEDIDPELIQTTKGQVGSKAEDAIFLSLQLYALLHQGSRQITKFSKVSLGEAVKRLVKSDEDEQRVLRRFKPLLTAQSSEEIAVYLRGLIQLLRQESIDLDFVQLAADIYLLYSEATSESVKKKWIRDFYLRKSE